MRDQQPRKSKRGGARIEMARSAIDGWWACEGVSNPLERLTWAQRGKNQNDRNRA